MRVGWARAANSVVKASPARMGPTVWEEEGPMPMRNMSKTDRGWGASVAGISPDTMAAAVGRPAWYWPRGESRGTGCGSMATIVPEAVGAGLPTPRLDGRRRPRLGASPPS